MGITSGTGYPTTRQEFGCHSICAVNRTTKVVTGMVEIIGDISLEFSASSVDNRGGSSLYPRATEITEIDSTISFNIRQWDDWIFENYMAATVSTTAASATVGTIGTPANITGTSAYSASGVASVTLTSGGASDLKTGPYLVVAASASTVNVYRPTTFQSNRGTDLYLDDNVGKITTTALTIASGTAVAIPGTGLTLTGTGGAGASISMTAGDSFQFFVTPPHNGISQVDIGISGNVFPEHELIIFGKQRGSGEAVWIQCYKAQCVSGMTFPMSQSDFAATDVSVKLLLDTAVNKVATIYFSSQIL